jgi:hypothetical protein
VFAEREVITTNLDLNRIAEWSETDQLNGCANQKSHLQKPSAMFGVYFDLGNGPGAARLKGGQRLRVSGHRLFLGQFAVDRLDENCVRELRANSKPGIANLANDICLPADKSDLLFFTEPHLTQAMQNFRGPGQLLDPNGGARHDPAQWAKKWLFGAAIFV